jgi:type VI secretion system protein ImpH
MSHWLHTSLAPAAPARINQVLAQAQRLPFVVLVDWLQRLLPTHSAVGGDGPAYAEAVRFCHDPDLRFHDADVVEASLVEPEVAGGYVQLTTTFAGLTGAASPLPPALIERLCRDDNDESAVQREFLDLFHHRLLCLFFRGRLKFDLPRSSSPLGVGRALDWVMLLAGLAPEHAERLTQLPRAVLLTLAPLLVCYPATAERIAVAVRFVFADLLGEAEVHIAELRGGVATIEPSSRVRLGVDIRLGSTSTLGGRAPSPSQQLTVQIGPLCADACAHLCPGGDRHHEFAAVTTLFCPETIRIAVELTASTTPVVQLGANGALLGRGTWLRGHVRPRAICFSLPAPSSP